MEETEDVCTEEEQECSLCKIEKVFLISRYLSQRHEVRAQGLCPRENSMYKGPEAEMCLPYCRNSKETSVPRLKLQGRAATKQTMGFIGCWGNRTPLKGFFFSRGLSVFKRITQAVILRTDSIPIFW